MHNVVVTLNEHSAPGTQICTLRVLDDDNMPHAQFEYALVGDGADSFRVERQVGVGPTMIVTGCSRTTRHCTR